MSSNTKLRFCEILTVVTPEGDLQIVDYSDNHEAGASLIEDLREVGIETELITRGWCG